MKSRHFHIATALCQLCACSVLSAQTTVDSSESFTKQVTKEDSLSYVLSDTIFPDRSAVIGDSMTDPIEAGIYSDSFSYTDTRVTTYPYTNKYGQYTRDVFYCIVLTVPMNVTFTHEGSTLSDTYMHLLDSNGNRIALNDDYSGEGHCTNTQHAFIRRQLTAGVYYVVSEGFSRNGSITTNITGYASTTFNYPTIPSSYSTMPGTAVGGMGATFGVSPMGGATLNIPIEVPMGVGGLQPNLSIVYNSQSGNGLCGYGASLAGLSSITRGPKDIYHDNAAKGIKYWTDDAFYLDGVRLELESGTPGQYGTVYVPENDPYTKVITHGSSNSISDSTWFEVQASDGMIYWYGNSSASRLIYEDGNKTKIQSWNLSFVKQPSGNFINLSYLTDNNCLYPSVIAYGTNLNQSNTLRDTIYFTYESRSDSVPIRFDGQKGSMKKRLSGITGKVNGEIYRKYTLNYDTTGDGTARKFSRLLNVTVGNSLGETLPATQLNWSYLPTVSYQSTGMPVANPDVSSVVSFPFSGQVFAAGDLNNDGLADIAGFSNVSISNGHGGYYEKTYLYIYWAQKSSTGITYPSGRLFEMNPSFDMNIFRDRPTGCFYSYYEGGAVSDWNGDGYNELFLPNFEDMADQQNLSFYIRGVKPDGSKLEQQVNCPLYTNGNAVYAINDIDNNGKCDIVVVEKEAYNGSYICTLLTQASNGNLSYAQLNLSMLSSPRRVYLTDMNNNGLKDLLIVCEENYTVYWNQGGPISTIMYSDSF